MADVTLEACAKPYLLRIEAKLDALDTLRATFKADCKIVHDDIREIVGEAKDAGIVVKALNGLHQYRRLERKQAKVTDAFDADEAAAYEQLVDALGSLGVAAARAAGFAYEGD